MIEFDRRVRNIDKKEIKMEIKSLIFQIIFVLLSFTQFGRSLEVSDFYDFERTVLLENGLEKSELIKLEKPINFYSDMYDQIYVSDRHFLNFSSQKKS